MNVAYDPAIKAWMWDEDCDGVCERSCSAIEATMVLTGIERVELFGMALDAMGL